MNQTCKWCGVSYAEHPDRSSGMMETFCELKQLRDLRDGFLDWYEDSKKHPFEEIENIADRARELKRVSG
jgi:hypothetical protein